jgi:hypothetical protein
MGIQMAIDPVMQDLNRQLDAEAAAELFGYAVGAVLDRWMGEHKRVADALDDIMAESDHRPQGYTTFGDGLAMFAMLDSEADAVRYRATLREMVRAQLRSAAEEEVRRNDARIEAAEEPDHE